MKSIQKLFQHVYWSNQRVLETLQSQDNEEARRIFPHVLCAEKVWLARLLGKDSSRLPIWKDMSLTECTTYVMKNENDLSKFITEMESEPDNDCLVSYKNSKGARV